MNIITLSEENSLVQEMVNQVVTRLPSGHNIHHLPVQPETDEHKALFVDAGVIVALELGKAWPTPEKLKLVQVPAAGWDKIDTSVLAADAVICNTFGHEIPIAEYVMAALLHWQFPFVDAVQRMRNNDWYYHTPAGFENRKELYGNTLGILGYGMIGREVAKRAKAFGMTVLACNLTSVSPGEETCVDQYYELKDVKAFASQVDFLSVSLALVDETANIIDAELLAGMKENAVVVNVGRAGLVDEQALFAALETKSIRGAVLDPQYHYPNRDNPSPKPTNLDFSSLDNALLTSHMAGGSDCLLTRRGQNAADNIVRLAEGKPLDNIVWQSS